LKFTSEDHLRKTIDRIVGRVGRRIDESSPLVDARLLDGSRVNAVVPPIALDGANITIRKFFKEPFTARDMLVTGTITPSALEILEACVRGRLNIVISGGTGSGKTTTLNVLSSFIPEDERIVTIEDSAELQLNKPHVIRLETRPANIEGSGSISIRELVRNSLRMRPDRIVVGEVRDGAALDMLQAMNTGHDGSLTTVHANNPLDAVSRLETMGLMAGMELPVLVIRDQIGRAIDLIVQQSRLRDGSRHITAITEIIEVADGVLKTQDLFKFDYFETPVDNRLGVLRPTGALPTFVNRLAEAGVNLNMASFQR
jgi:pilus assembly protein CpaF